MSVTMTNRRDLLIAPLLAAAASSLGAASSEAKGIDPRETIIDLPGQIPWKPIYDMPPGAAERALVFGSKDETGLYLTLVRWHPGYMSAPHSYDTDRLCLVLSGTWYLGNGEDFAPEATVPVPAGSFVHRVGKTVHYDGVIKGADGPVTIAIAGIGPTNFRLVDKTMPTWRKG